IAKSVLIYITKKIGCKTLFATHYHELTSMELELDGVKNYNIAVKKHGDDITFLRKIIKGGADDSYGIEVAKLAGLPQAVIDNAKEILISLESEKPSYIIKKEVNPQICLGSTEINDKLKALQLDTLTPLEAINTLYELKSML
ncbi:MAG: DNA mismatch repair protein MutS, partial [Oscillospiraceae bacterium]